MGSSDNDARWWPPYSALIATLAIGPSAVAALAIGTGPGCASRDCAEERAGEQRCVGNRIETCNEDGTLSYESCSARGLVCSEKLAACVTEEVAMTTSGGGSGQAGGAGGDGGSAGTGGQGGQ